MSAAIDLSGKAFGHWTALRRLPGQQWECRCRCGAVKEIDGGNLRTGKTKSCGCAGLLSGENNPARRAARLRHGINFMGKDSPWYNHTAGIFARCRQSGIENGFKSIAELAVYCEEICPEVCPVFGVPFARGAAGFSPWAPSVDRKDNSRGYVRGNLQIISFKANSMKANASMEELRTFARWILAQ